MKTENTVEMLVDKLGAMKKIVDDYKREMKVLEDEIKNYCNANDVNKIYGSVFNATYVEANRKNVDWKTLLDDMGVDANTREQYTTTSAIFSLKLGV